MEINFLIGKIKHTVKTRTQRRAKEVIITRPAAPHSQLQLNCWRNKHLLQKDTRASVCQLHHLTSLSQGLIQHLNPWQEHIPCHQKEGNKSVTNCNQLRPVSPKMERNTKASDYLPPADRHQMLPEENDDEWYEESKRRRKVFLRFFLFCKARPARAVERSSSAAASLLVGWQWSAFDTAVPNARMLYRKEVSRWFLLTLCDFVSLCFINLSLWLW